MFVMRALIAFRITTGRAFVNYQPPRGGRAQVPLLLNLPISYEPSPQSAPLPAYPRECRLSAPPPVPLFPRVSKRPAPPQFARPVPPPSLAHPATRPGFSPPVTFHPPHTSRPQPRQPRHDPTFRAAPASGGDRARDRRALRGLIVERAVRLHVDDARAAFPSH